MGAGLTRVGPFERSRTVAARLLAVYIAIVLAPLLVAAAAFALRDLLRRTARRKPTGNGHSEAGEGLEHTVEELRVSQAEG
jgi:membrane protein implicated in regulation of membrane protease activity